MKTFVTILIFLVVLFIYIHINFHLQTSDDLEVFELTDISKSKLEEVCDLKQPAIFNFKLDLDNIYPFNKSYFLKNYNSFDIQIRACREEQDTNFDYDQELLILPFNAGIKLFNEDPKSCYFSENNINFLKETTILKTIQQNDMFIRPYLVSNCNYDFIIGSNNSFTPFRFDISHRNYFVVTEGSVQIKLSPPNSSKYLYTDYDYYNFEFRSPINPWNTQNKYIADFKKIKCMDITLSVGQTIYIPPYWWYSILNQTDSCVLNFKYRTYMNNLAIIPHLSKYVLQRQNIKHKTIKKYKNMSAPNSLSTNIETTNESTKESTKEPTKELAISKENGTSKDIVTSNKDTSTNTNSTITKQHPNNTNKFNYEESLLYNSTYM